MLIFLGWPMYQRHHSSGQMNCQGHLANLILLCWTSVTPTYCMCAVWARFGKQQHIRQLLLNTTATSIQLLTTSYYTKVIPYTLSISRKIGGIESQLTRFSLCDLRISPILLSICVVKSILLATGAEREMLYNKALYCMRWLSGNRFYRVKEQLVKTSNLRLIAIL